MEIEFDINSVDKIPEHKYECKYWALPIWSTRFWCIQRNNISME